MNILLTGVEGFIGKNIKESYLNDDHIIYSPDINELDILCEDDVRNYIINSNIEIVIHSAAKAGHRNAADPSGIFYNNTRMIFSLIRNMDILRKIILMGSGAIYDQRYYKDNMPEEYADEHLPVDEHGLCKHVIYKYISARNDNRIIDLRIFGIFGRYEDYAIRFISNMCCKAIFDLDLTMNQNRFFSYLDINDLIPIIDFFIHNDPVFNSYNITPDRSVYLYELATLVRDISGKKLDIKTKHNGYGMSYTGDNSRLKNEYQDIKFTDIQTSIENLYRWYYNNRHNIDKSLLLFDK